MFGIIRGYKHFRLKVVPKFRLCSKEKIVFCTYGILSQVYFVFCENALGGYTV